MQNKRSQILKSKLLDQFQNFLPDRQSSAVIPTTDQDLFFLRRILPTSISPGGLHLKSGNCYMTTIIVNRFPSRIQPLIFAELFNKPGITVTMDLKIAQKSQAVEDLEKSINELDTRIYVNRHSSENRNDAYELRDLLDLHARLQLTSEDFAYMTLRFVVYALSPDELEDKVQKLNDELKTKGMYGFIPEYEQLAEFRGLQSTANTVKQPIPVLETLKEQFPFYFQSFADPRGILWGITGTDGLVLLDTFRITGQRKSFDMVIVGQKGAGKSALLKYLTQIQLALGRKVLTYDLDGEMADFTEKNHGKTVRPTDESGYVNMLELHPMFSAKFEEARKAADEKSVIRANFTSELSRIVNNFRQLFPKMDEVQVNELRDLLTKLYRSFGITQATPLEHFSPTEFPIMRNLYDIICDTLYMRDENRKLHYKASVGDSRKQALELLAGAVKPLQRDGMYAPLFDHHSTINVSKENLVVFDMSLLSEMEDNIYNAMLFLVVSLMWSEVYKNRTENDHLPEDKRRYCVVEFDEAHRVMNTQNIWGLNFIEKMVRRDRKYYAGIWFSSQQPRDFAPSGDSENLDKIKNIFGLVQYKILMQQDESNFDILKQLFPQFTESELESTAMFDKGEQLVSMGAGAKIHCKTVIPNEYLAYFGGGK